jgi:hypothetical protein
VRGADGAEGGCRHVLGANGGEAMEAVVDALQLCRWLGRSARWST